MDPTALKQALTAQAEAVGFSACQICATDSVPQIADRLAQFVAAGQHGQMAWMADRMHWRGDPSALWPEAKSVIMLAEVYTPSHDPLAILEQPEKAAISVYAQNRDYHDLVKKRLKKLGRWLIETANKGGVPDPQIKVFVDTAPVMEKPLAAAAGLGWQGKHTNLVSRELGSWFFLGAIFTTLDLPKDTAEADHCGSCRACLDICPTNAFPAPYQLDARRCISYITIEHKGPVDHNLRPLLGNRIYGCDDCLAVCPWNKFAQGAHEIGYHPREGVKDAALLDLVTLDDASFRLLFSKSPIKRIGRNQFIRNVLYAIGNAAGSAHVEDLKSAAQALLSDEDPTVCDAASWAVQRLTI